MRSLLYTVFVVYIVAVLFYVLEMTFFIRIAMMALLGVGVIFGKFAYDYYQNKKASDTFLKYAIYSGLAFLFHSGAMFTMGKIPPNISIVFYLFSLLIFAMIGVNNSLTAMRSTSEKDKKQRGIFYLSLFAIHGLYAFILASSFLKGYHMHYLVPAILIFDILILLPFIIIKKAYNQYLLLGLFVVSMIINSYLMFLIPSLQS